MPISSASILHSAFSILHFPPALSWPLRTEHMPGWLVLVLFLVGAVPIVGLGVYSLAGLGRVRQWVAIGLRLAVLLLALMILAGVQWQREHKDVEVPDELFSRTMSVSIPTYDVLMYATLRNVYLYKHPQAGE